MQDHIEGGTLTRGADGVLYLLSPGRCVQVDPSDSQVLEVGKEDDKAAIGHDGAASADHMSSRMEVDPGDLDSGRMLINPGDQLSARMLVDPGDADAARMLINPGDELSAKMLVDPGDSDSARMLVDPGDSDSAKMLIGPGEGLVN